MRTLFALTLLAAAGQATKQFFDDMDDMTTGTAEATTADPLDTQDVAAPETGTTDEAATTD